MKGRTTGGHQTGMRARIDKKRVAKHAARVARLKQQAKKIEPKRPDDPGDPGPKI